MKKVMIALDYDPTAQKIAEAGYSLAKEMGAEVLNASSPLTAGCISIDLFFVRLIIN